jgi:uncharacterized protein YkwD
MRRGGSAILCIVGVCAIGFFACGPRKAAKHPTTVATTPTPTPFTVATGAPTDEPETVLGPAWMPKGLVWPPGVPPIAIPTGFPTVVAPWPSVFPFPLPTIATPTPTATTPPAPPTPIPPPAPGDSDTALENAVLVEVNARRAQGATCGGTAFAPAKPLTMNEQLRVAARRHSVDMGVRGYFDHVSPEGTQPADRMKAAGFDVSVGWNGENIAAGRATAQGTVQQWMDSPGHCENIMDPHFTVIGVGHAFVASSKYRNYWTQDFAGPP